MKKKIATARDKGNKFATDLKVKVTKIDRNVYITAGIKPYETDIYVNVDRAKEEILGCLEVWKKQINSKIKEIEEGMK